MMGEMLDRIILDPSAEGPEWSLVAAGDFCMQGRSDNDLSRVLKRSITSELCERIAAGSIAIVNLEGPVVTAPSPIVKSGPAIMLDSISPALLRETGFTLASLANNHIMDHGAAGLRSTLDSCRAAGLATIGAGVDEDEAMAAFESSPVPGVRVAILSFCEREFGSARAAAPGASWIGHRDALRRVTEAAKNADVVIVIAHGGVEEVPFPPVQRQDQLRSMIDAGADLVIGHHPHVPQGWERWGDGMIFHSLGNFLFDYPDGARYPKTEWGMMIDARFRGARLHAIELIPIEMRDDRSAGIIDDPARHEHSLRYLHATSAILADRPLFEGYWQATALHLWKGRYHRWLAKASGASGPRDNLRDQFSGLRRGLQRRLGLASEVSSGPADVDPAFLLNLIRNESHRWTIETALALSCGDEQDRRSDAIETHLRELLAWTEE